MAAFCDRQTGFPASDADSVSIISWNLLAPSFDRYGLDWKTVRLPSLRRWLARFADCDVICVQELDLAFALEEVRELLAACGFEVVVQDRKDFPVVNATFFKTSRFQLSWAEHRSRVLLCGLMLPDGRELGVANVHLEAGAATSNEAQRTSQLRSALCRLRTRSTWCEVVCGDFNTSLRDGSTLRAQLVQAGLTTASGTGPTHVVPGCSQTLDHIWAGEALRPTAVLDSYPAELRALDAAGLPNKEHPSDHLPVGVAFFMVPRGRAIFPSVEPPAGVREELRREWLELLSLAPGLGASKRAKREHRRLEGAFLTTLVAEEAEQLKAWRTAASQAAVELLRVASHQALAAAQVLANEADEAYVAAKVAVQALKSASLPRVGGA